MKYFQEFIVFFQDGHLKHEGCPCRAPAWEVYSCTAICDFSHFHFLPSLVFTWEVYGNRNLQFFLVFHFSHPFFPFRDISLLLLSLFSCPLSPLSFREVFAFTLTMSCFSSNRKSFCTFYFSSVSSIQRSYLLPLSLFLPSRPLREGCSLSLFLPSFPFREVFISL